MSAALSAELSASGRLVLSRERLRRALHDLSAAPAAAANPLRVAGMVVAEAAKAVLQPIAKRHPLGLVVGALLLGGLLAWSRPWRWFLEPALFAGLLPQLVSKAVAQLPLESWLAVLTTLTQERTAPGRSEAAAP